MSALIAVPLVPLLTAGLILTLRRASGWLCAGATSLSLLLTLLLTGRSVEGRVGWLESGPYTLTVGLSLDPLSYLTALVVSGVGFLVSLYAVSYMKDERDTSRFFALLAFFIGAMLALVLSNSFVLLFAAWEGVGLASYGLIGFWYKRRGAQRAARKAFLVTRLGDLGLFLGWLLALLLVGTTDIFTFLTSSGGVASGTLTLLALLFLLGAVGKSAQLPLTAWLPDAMAGPTPVSALIHSATMVAAGVYLLIRLFPLFEAAPGALSAVATVGGLTALFAALVATAQFDIKRVLAWSTVSQLGEMMLALGLGGAAAAAFHLSTHAVFKAALFLAAGILGHAVGGYDLRRMGNLSRALPWTAAAFAAAGLALAGVPPFSGFWSEEAILGWAANSSPLLGVLLLVLIFLAGVYISRAGVAAFAPREGQAEPKSHRTPWPMLVGTLILAVLASGMGWFLRGRLEPFLGLSEAPHVSSLWTLLAVASSAGGIAFGGWRAWRGGAAPAFGAFPAAWGEALNDATRAPALAVQRLAFGTENLERGFDASARGIAAAAWRGSRGLELLETGFGDGAKGLAHATLLAAMGTEEAERRGFSDGGDRFARFLGRTGQRLRGLQTGKLYLYTLTLFAWTFAVVVFGVLLWR